MNGISIIIIIVCRWITEILHIFVYMWKQCNCFENSVFKTHSYTSGCAVRLAGQPIVALTCFIIMCEKYDEWKITSRCTMHLLCWSASILSIFHSHYYAYLFHTLKQNYYFHRVQITGTIPCNIWICVLFVGIFLFLVYLLL